MYASSAPAGYGQSTPAFVAVQPAADAFRNEALVFERYDTTYRMRADGVLFVPKPAILRLPD